MIACDTTVLSHFLRRPQPADSTIANAVENLIEEKSAALFGVVRQELLSGLKHESDFNRIDLALSPLPLFLAEESDHTTAARFYNSCRAKGIQGSPVDFLICAMAVRRDLPIFTTDPDFIHYERIIPIELHVA